MDRKIIFSFVLINFVIASCNSTPILPNVALRIRNAESYENIKEPISKNIRSYNGIGPLAPHVLQQNPRLVFIGTINAKSFYIEREAVDWDSAVALCERLEMHIAKFDSQEELNLIYANLPSDDGYVWTGAKVNLSQDWPRYYWQDSESSLMNPPLQWFYSFKAEIVLVYSVDAAEYPGLYGMSLKSDLHYPICYV